MIMQNYMRLLQVDTASLEPHQYKKKHCSHVCNYGTNCRTCYLLLHTRPLWLGCNLQYAPET